ncbi:dihydroneopterin aldolase [Rhodoluna sp.]|uniref:dihydroneopterin aldolase n=1 Tax=Rhodoluna sp. TaxID=1969481 RepID=UPI0025E89D6E|nr:dihydroneopterin aldolase [Rhodoluna sp.]
MHKIKLTGLRVFAHHGVMDFERTNGQEFFIDATVWLDASAAVKADDLAKTVNYGMLADLIAANVASEPVDLIETLAQRLLSMVLALPGPIIDAEITVHKPHAPIDHVFTDVSVTVGATK